MFIPGSSHDFKNSCIKHEFKIHSSARKGPMPGSHLPHLAMQSRPAMSQDLSMTNAPGLITAICPISIDTTTLEPMSAESQAHHRWNLSPSVESQVPLGAHRFFIASELENHDWVTLARARVVPRRTRCRRQHAPPNAPPPSRWTLCAESDHASPPGSCAGRRRAAEAAPRVGCSQCYDGPTLCAWEGL